MLNRVPGTRFTEWKSGCLTQSDALNSASASTSLFWTKEKLFSLCLSHFPDGYCGWGDGKSFQLFSSRKANVVTIVVCNVIAVILAHADDILNLLLQCKLFCTVAFSHRSLQSISVRSCKLYVMQRELPTDLTFHLFCYSLIQQGFSKKFPKSCTNTTLQECFRQECFGQDSSPLHSWQNISAMNGFLTSVRIIENTKQKMPSAFSLYILDHFKIQGFDPTSTACC